mgnify:CR=1 FL=1
MNSNDYAKHRVSSVSRTYVNLHIRVYIRMCGYYVNAQMTLLRATHVYIKKRVAHKLY